MTDRKPTPERFAEAVNLAVILPHPTDIYRAILAGSRNVDDGLRGTAYDSDRTAGGTPSSHPERMLEQRHPGQFPRGDEDEAVPGQWGARTDRAKDDLVHLNRACDRVLEAIDSLNAECCDAGTVDTWDDAIADANVLTEAGYLVAAMDVGRNVEHWALRFVHAIDTVRAIRDSWMPHDAPQSIAEENFTWCHSHGRLNLKERRTTRRLCRWCYRHVEDLAEFSAETAVELQERSECWPSVEMIQAKHDHRRVVYGREHAAWLRSHGVDPVIAHQRRQGRRSA